MEPEIFNALPFSWQDLLLVIKGFYLLGLLLYIIFAGLIVRQVQMMMNSLAGVLKLPLPALAWGHFFATILVFVLAAVIL